MREYDEIDYLPLSGIQHFTYCRRQWALIHIEQQWQNNFFTSSGNVSHENVHNGIPVEKRKDTILIRGLQVSSRVLGVNGICDAVELTKSENGTYIKKYDNKYIILPVEYKRGSPKEHDADVMQVVAQAMCLEEMLCTSIPEAAIYYGQTKYRQYYLLTNERRSKIISICEEMHDYFSRNHTPKCRVSKKCDKCSLKELCLPGISTNKNVSDYISETILKGGDI